MVLFHEKFIIFSLYLTETQFLLVFIYPAVDKRQIFLHNVTVNRNQNEKTGDAVS